MDFSLFRVKVLLPGDPTLFAGSMTPSEVLEAMILERPTARAWNRQVWHIGNVERIDENGVYFALGRTARTTRPVLDENTGNFVENEFDHAPYTHVVLDLPTEVCAIARRGELAPTTEAIGNRLERVLAATRLAGELHAVVQVSPVSDPSRFLEDLRAAYAIRSFTFTVTRPNAFDIEKDIVKPLEEYTREAGADTGSTTVRGQALKLEPLEDIARSAAATGDNASARLKLNQRGRAVVRRLRGDAAAINHLDVDSREEKAGLLAKLRAQYRRIRGSEGVEEDA